jgi:hypothetical protein
MEAGAERLLRGLGQRGEQLGERDLLEIQLAGAHVGEAARLDPRRGDGRPEIAYTRPAGPLPWNA